MGSHARSPLKSRDSSGRYLTEVDEVDVLLHLRHVVGEGRVRPPQRLGITHKQ